MAAQRFDSLRCDPECPGSPKHESAIAVLESQFLNIEASLTRIEAGMVNRAEFTPVQRLVYGVTGFVLLAVGGAILALVIHKV